MTKSEHYIGSHKSFYWTYWAYCIQKTLEQLPHFACFCFYYMLRRKCFHDSSHLLEIFTSCLLLYHFLCPSQPSLSHWGKKLITAETFSPSHFSSTSKLPCWDHIKLPLMRPKQTWLKPQLLKLVHSSQLWILIDHQFLFQLHQWISM